MFDSLQNGRQSLRSFTELKVEDFRKKLTAVYGEIINEYESYDNNISEIDKQRDALSISRKYRMAKTHCVLFQFHMEKIWQMGLAQSHLDEVSWRLMHKHNGPDLMTAFLNDVNLYYSTNMEAYSVGDNKSTSALP